MVGQRIWLITLLLAACGGVSPASTGTACPNIPAPRDSVPPVVASADQGRVDPGGTVTFTETISGPASLQIECSGPLQVVVTDGTGLSIYTGSGSAVSGSLCGSVTLASGASQSYQVSWPVDPSLPGGDYAASLVLGDAPQLTLTVAVGVIAGNC